MDPFRSASADGAIPYAPPPHDEDDRGTLCDGTQSLSIEYNYVPDLRPPHVSENITTIGMQPSTTSPTACEPHSSRLVRGGNRKDGIKEASRLRSRDFLILDRGFDSVVNSL